MKRPLLMKHAQLDGLHPSLRPKDGLLLYLFYDNVRECQLHFILPNNRTSFILALIDVRR